MTHGPVPTWRRDRAVAVKMMARLTTAHLEVIMAGNKTERLEGRTGQVWQLYIDGNTQQAIAERFDISQSHVSKILAEVRASIPQQTRDEIVRERVEQLAKFRMVLAEAANDGDPQAIQMALKVQEREAKLLGLDSAVKQEVDATVQYRIVGVNPNEIV